jgi:putative drug exporter of the RND superfamily
MALLGRWNWWLPGWLDRILPGVPVEAGDGVEIAFSDRDAARV